MNYRRSIFTPLGAIALIAAAGCTPKVVNPKQNVRPLIELTRAPYNESTRFEYAYRMNWLGYDPDGRVDHYLYAIDPPAATPQKPEPDTAWVQTDKSERLIDFSATQIDDSKPGVHGASDFHTFVVKAIDNGGLGGPLQSAPLVRSFFTYTVAPTVQILDPVPHDGYRVYVTPAVRISWTGSDDDGILDNQKPVKYKYILLTKNTPINFQTALQYPDSVRAYYAARNWAGWDSTTADTTSKLYTNLVVGSDYMFVVIAFDEAGAYSPVFSQNSNMLNMRVTFAAQGGPLITIFNDFVFYHFDQGVYSTEEKYQIKVEVPAGEKITFHWFAEIPPGSGASLRGFRWAVDIEDVSDNTPRTNEATDWKHWSQESGDATSATIGPFGGGEVHYFYLEAIDTNGLRSLAVVRITSVQSDLTQDLLIVDDTRLKPDQLAAGGCTKPPSGYGRWPSAAEADTFLYAKGGYAWRCYPAGTISRPGLFDGYPFDTTGTRTGTGETRISLAQLGHYKHVIWLTDLTLGANSNLNPGHEPPRTALRFMSEAGHANSISAYLRQGGQVWLAGGGIASATLLDFNQTSNDHTLPAPGITFTSDPHETPNVPLELQPGRFMYDVAHWQSQIKETATVLSGLYRYLGRFEAPGHTVPLKYRNLPTSMRFRSLALGDSLPPQRFASDYFLNQPITDLEYLSKANRIVEDVDPSPLGIDEQSTMDTLYYATGSSLVDTSYNDYDVCMTVYDGPAYPHPIIFTGFNLWFWTKSDCRALIDAVVHDMWGYSRAASSPRPQVVAGASRAAARAAPAPLRNAAAMPVRNLGRTPER